VFADTQLVRAPAANQPLDAGALPFGEFSQRVGAILAYGIIWDEWLAYHWEPDFPAALNAVVRPTQPNGFEYLCTQEGQTNGDEPQWPTIVGGIVGDGSAQWQCQPVDSTSLAASVATSAWSAPSPMTVSSPVLTGNTATVLINTTSAVSGSTYDVLNTITTSDGQTQPGKIRIKVV
jgi:hypothetical protein